MNLKLSVVGLCYGNAPYVIEALESIVTSRAEIVDWILVDDGSPDSANRDILRDWATISEKEVELRLFEENRGVPVRLNEVRTLIRGDYAIFIGDDVFVPGSIDRMFEAAIDVDFPDVLTGVAQWFNEDLSAAMGVFWGALGAEGGYPKEVSAGSLRKRIMSGNFISAPSTIWKLSFLEECGGFDEHYVFEDWPVWMKICAEYPAARILFMGEVVVKYRRLLPSNAAVSPARKVWREKLAVDKILLRVEFGDSRLRTDREVVYRQLAALRWELPANQKRVVQHPLVRKWFPVSRFMACASQGRTYALGPVLANIEGFVIRNLVRFNPFVKDK